MENEFLKIKANEIRKDIERRFEQSKKVLTKNNFKQSLIIKDAIVLKNEKGTAPSLLVEYKGKIIILLPGPPEELKFIFETKLSLYLKNFSFYIIHKCIF